MRRGPFFSLFSTVSILFEISSLLSKMLNNDESIIELLQEQDGGKSNVEKVKKDLKE